MMACRFGLLLITILPFTVFAQTAKPDAHPFLVTMGEAWSNPQPSAGPINAMNCVIIFPDGQLHLELSRQEFFAEKPTSGSMKLLRMGKNSWLYAIY